MTSALHSLTTVVSHGYPQLQGRLETRSSNRLCCCPKENQGSVRKEVRMDTGQQPRFPATFVLWATEGCPWSCLPTCTGRVCLLWGPVLLPPAEAEEDAQSRSVLASDKPTRELRCVSRSPPPPRSSAWGKWANRAPPRLCHFPSDQRFLG